MNPFLEGLVLQASLIVALGAQNLFVLDCGLQKRHPLAVALVCSLCDLILIILGVFGAAVLFETVPLFQPILAIAGVTFLIYYGVKKLREAHRPEAFNMFSPRVSTTLQATLIAALGFSLLNPHVYLDTVVLIGGYSSRFASISDRMLFGAGAASFSLFWFIALSLGASAISSKMKSPRFLRWISFGAGLVLIALGLKLGWEAHLTYLSY